MTPSTLAAAPAAASFTPPTGARTAPDGPVFRADRFLVPLAVLDDFMAQVQRVDRSVAALPGCRRHLVLLRMDGLERADEAVEVMTIVEWADAAALQAAKAAMQQRYEREGFRPAAYLQALGVRADMGSYGLAA